MTPQKKNAGQEMERKFLVKTPPPGWKNQVHIKIAQGYLARSDNVEVRLRQADDTHFLTIKGGSGVKRQEEEIELSPDCFARLWPLTKGRRISKTRYKISFANRTIEMDVYNGPHRGLITAEIEFKNRRELRAFHSPEWFDEEVSENPEYANAVLAMKRSLPVKTGK